VQATAVDWEIPSLIPSAAVVMFTGLPGIGKSTVLADLIARVTTGANAPASDSPMRAGACIVLCREDDRATTIVPRLAAAGADLERVVFVDQVRIPQTGDTRELRLPFDVAAIERAVIQERARWVVIDPLSDYLVNVDTNSEHDVRRALLPLVRLAQDHRVTVIFVQHMTKRDHSTALLRGVGSIAFGAVVRAAVLVDMTEAGLVMRSVKSNLGPKAPPLGFDLVGEPGQPAARVVWRTVNAAPVEKETAVDRAKTFLLEHVTVDGVLAREINARARALGIGMTNLRAAKALLGVVSVPPGGPTARWVLPTNHANDAAPNGARRVDVMTAPSSEAR
jgi:KaiC/GvpD/RAD55 family RecA-like ATPase